MIRVGEQLPDGLTRDVRSLRWSEKLCCLDLVLCSQGKKELKGTDTGRLKATRVWLFQ